MSLSAVNGALSNLKACLADIATGMDIVTDVAIDLVETQGKYCKHEFCKYYNQKVIIFIVKQSSYIMF